MQKFLKDCDVFAHINMFLPCSKLDSQYVLAMGADPDVMQKIWEAAACWYNVPVRNMNDMN